MVLLHLFAVAGFVFVGVFFAIRFKLTNVKGSVDKMSSAFQQEADQVKILGVAISNTNTVNEIAQLSEARDTKIKLICELNELSYIAPINVGKIMEVKKTKVGGDDLIQKMVFAIKTKIGSTEQNLEMDVKKCIDDFEKAPILETEIEERLVGVNGIDIFDWANYQEWQNAKQAIAKDEAIIKQAAAMVEIDPRLIVSDLMVEQLRLYFSVRELYKQYFEPLKILSNSNKISLGVMSIKEDTAKKVEIYLKDKNSPYYLGEKYEHLLDYGTNFLSPINPDNLYSLNPF